MSKHDNGGPAFPTLQHEHVPGMTLRDHFAVNAPDVPEGFGLGSKPGWQPCMDSPGGHEIYQSVLMRWQLDRQARWAYLHADAMLAAREEDQP